MLKCLTINTNEYIIKDLSIKTFDLISNYSLDVKWFLNKSNKLIETIN